jgi:TonB-linked SusC/RagA family outer membrane protein
MKLCCTKKASALGQAFKHFAWVMLLLVLGTSAAFAQTTVSGTLTDAKTSEPLPGVTIAVKGTTKGTITDVDGKYTLSISAEDKVLVFSYIGYTPKEVSINNQSNIDVALQGDAVLLNEYTTTAFNISKEKGRVSSSVQSVQGDLLVKAREPNGINSLTGKIAGLTVGSSPELLGRPNVLLRGSADLLYVVDGVPINSDTWNISPDDIETYTVLKGATSSALYGFRGRNGAIIITTKKGSKDKRGFSVDFNSSTMIDKGFNAIPKVQDLYGPGDHGNYAFVDGKGGGLNDNDYDIWGPALDGRLLPQYDSPVDPKTGKLIPTPWIPRGKDNLQRFLRPGILSSNNISVSSSGDRYQMRFSMSNNYQQGIVPNTQLNITNFNASLGYDFSKRLRFDANINYNRQYTDNIPDVNYGPNSLIYNITIWGGADWNVDDMKKLWQDGKEGVQQIYAEYQRYNNPWFMAQKWLRGHYKNDIYGYMSMTYEVAKDIKLMGRTNVTTYDLFRSEKFPYSATVYGREQSKGDYREDRRNLFENNTDLVLTVGNKSIGKLINVSGLAGGTVRTFKYNSSYASTDYLITPGVYSFSNSLNPASINSFASNMQVLSGYYSADVSVGYYLTLSHTGRVDKISTLPTGNQTFYYPSVGASTLVTEYVKLGPISNLKLRGAYANVKDALTQSTVGPLGTGNSNPLPYGSTYTSSYDGPSYSNSQVYSTVVGYNNSRAAYYGNTLSNPALQRNSRSEVEFGFDLGLFKNKVNIEATYFNIKEGPRIFAREISETSGYTNQLANGIFTRKKGVEIHISADPFKSSAKGLKWRPEINFSTLRERYIDFYTNPDGTRVQSYGNIQTQLGDRVDELNGSAFYRTADGKIINDGSGRPIANPRAQLLGYVDPNFVWSFINRFSYKNFVLSIQFDGRQGGQIVNYIQQQTFRGGRHINTVEGEMGVARLEDTKGNKTWLGEGVQIVSGTIKTDDYGNITNYNELTFKDNATKTYLQDWIGRYYNINEGNLMSRSFAKLREVVLTYNVPVKSGGFLSKLSVSLVARNLLYFAQRKDIDLDQYIGRATRSGLETPTLKRYGINVNMTF